MKVGKGFLLFMDFLWVVGFALVVSISMSLTWLLFDILGPKVSLFISVPVCAYVFINLYVLTSGLLCFLFVPKLKEGHYKMGSKQYIYWRLRWHCYSYVFLFFQRYVFYNRIIRYIYFRLMGINAKFTSYFAETVDMQDASNLLYLGENTGFGSEVLFATHLQLANNRFLLGKIEIGDNSIVSAKCSLSPNIKIGDNVVLEFGCTIGPGTRIGNNTTLGTNTFLSPYVTIGNNCKIGYCVHISAKSKIPDGTVIPNFAYWDSKIGTVIPDVDFGYRKIGTTISDFDYFGDKKGSEEQVEQRR